MLQSRTPRNPLGWVLSTILTFVIIYFVVKAGLWLLSLLWWVPLIMIIASLVIDRTVALGYVKTIKGLFDRKPAYGIGAAVASVIFYPVVAMYLLGMSLFRKKLKERAAEVDERVNGKWTEYEEVEEETLDLPYEELPPAPEPLPRKRRDDNKYDDLFE